MYEDHNLIVEGLRAQPEEDSEARSSRVLRQTSSVHFDSTYTKIET